MLKQYSYKSSKLFNLSDVKMTQSHQWNDKAKQAKGTVTIVEFHNKFNVETKVILHTASINNKTGNYTYIRLIQCYRTISAKIQDFPVLKFSNPYSIPKQNTSNYSFRHTITSP